jgi:hypothetical protein
MNIIKSLPAFYFFLKVEYEMTSLSFFLKDLPKRLKDVISSKENREKMVEFVSSLFNTSFSISSFLDCFNIMINVKFLNPSSSISSFLYFIIESVVNTFSSNFSTVVLPPVYPFSQNLVSYAYNVLLLLRHILIIVVYSRSFKISYTHAWSFLNLFCSPKFLTSVIHSPIFISYLRLLNHYIIPLLASSLGISDNAIQKCLFIDKNNNNNPINNDDVETSFFPFLESCCFSLTYTYHPFLPFASFKERPSPPLFPPSNSDVANFLSSNFSDILNENKINFTTGFSYVPALPSFSVFSLSSSSSSSSSSSFSSTSKPSSSFSTFKKSPFKKSKSSYISHLSFLPSSKEIFIPPELQFSSIAFISDTILEIVFSLISYLSPFIKKQISLLLHGIALLPFSKSGNNNGIKSDDTKYFSVLSGLLFSAKFVYLLFHDANLFAHIYSISSNDFLNIIIIDNKDEVSNASINSYLSLSLFHRILISPLLILNNQHLFSFKNYISENLIKNGVIISFHGTNNKTKITSSAASSSSSSFSIQCLSSLFSCLLFPISYENNYKSFFDNFSRSISYSFKNNSKNETFGSATMHYRFQEDSFTKITEIDKIDISARSNDVHSDFHYSCFSKSIDLKNFSGFVINSILDNLQDFSHLCDENLFLDSWISSSVSTSTFSPSSAGVISSSQLSSSHPSPSFQPSSSIQTSEHSSRYSSTSPHTPSPLLSLLTSSSSLVPSLYSLYTPEVHSTPDLDSFHYNNQNNVIYNFFNTNFDNFSNSLYLIFVYCLSFPFIISNTFFKMLEMKIILNNDKSSNSNNFNSSNVNLFFSNFKGNECEYNSISCNSLSFLHYPLVSSVFFNIEEFMKNSEQSHLLSDEKRISKKENSKEGKRDYNHFENVCVDIRNVDLVEYINFLDLGKRKKKLDLKNYLSFIFEDEIQDKKMANEDFLKNDLLNIHFPSNDWLSHPIFYSYIPESFMIDLSYTIICSSLSVVLFFVSENSILSNSLLELLPVPPFTLNLNFSKLQKKFITHMSTSKSFSVENSHTIPIKSQI